MGDDYKQQITARIKDSINQHIEKLKTEHPDLLITKQWSVVFPKGFVSGHNALPVVTSCKKGKYLVGKTLFMLPENLELDYDAIELVLKDEPYREKKRTKKVSPPPLDEPLDIINELIVNLNDFLQSFQLPVKSNPDPQSIGLFSRPGINSTRPIRILNGSQTDTMTRTDDITELKNRLINSTFLPDWFKMIESYEIRTELINKIAESLLHYQNKMGQEVSLKEFFDKYSEHLLSQDKIHHFCKYKSKAIKLDSSGHCTDFYCSKKPYNSPCSHAVLKFGKINGNGNGGY